MTSRICIKSHLLSFEYRVKINCDHRTRSILTDAIYRKHKGTRKSAMERIPLHSWEMEFSIQYHVTINSQLNDQNSIRYYITCIVYCSACYEQAGTQSVMERSQNSSVAIAV
jgi:hypothetical protein